MCFNPPPNISSSIVYAFFQCFAHEIVDRNVAFLVQGPQLADFFLVLSAVLDDLIVVGIDYVAKGQASSIVFRSM